MDPEREAQQRIVINTEDLDTAAVAPPAALPVRPAVAQPGQPRPMAPMAPLPSLPPSVGMPGPHPVSAGAGLAKLGSNAVLSGLLAGAVGGLLGAIALQVFHSPEHESIFQSAAKVRLNSGIDVAIIGCVIGFALMGWEGFTTGSPQKGFRDGAIGAAVGAVAGFIGGYIAQMLFTQILKNISLGDPGIRWKLRFARSGAWLIFGGLLGLGLGLRGGGRKTMNALIGGVIGGAAGGLIFEQIELSQTTSGSATTTRIIGFTITGIGIGLAIGLVERIRKDSWLVVAGGPMTGKEIILYKPTTMIGSDYRADLVLVKDPGVAPQHIALRRDGYGNVTMTVAPGAPAAVNGVPVQSHQLRPGDLIAVGGSLLQYQQRAVAPY